MGNSVYFVTLNPSEIKSKFSRLSAASVLFWVPLSFGEKDSEFRENVTYDANLHRLLLIKPQVVNVTEQFLCRLEIGPVVYFSSGKWKKGQEGSYFQLDSNVYRYEKRAQDRLLTYPHRQAYLVVEQEVEERGDNVIALHKHCSTLDELYHKLNPDKLQGKQRLRVLDISLSGLACLIGKKELEKFAYQKVAAILELDQQQYTLEINDLLYHVAYFDSHTANGSLMKIGLEYRPSAELQARIEFLLQDDGLMRFNVNHGFEEFILRQLK